MHDDADGVGTADDCFRFWEAIEAGSIPIYVRRNLTSGTIIHCPDAFEDVLRTNPPIVLLDRWEDLPKFIESVTEAEMDMRRRQLKVWSTKWWRATASGVDDAIEKALLDRLGGDKEQFNKLLVRDMH